MKKGENEGRRVIELCRNADHEGVTDVERGTKEEVNEGDSITEMPRKRK